MEQLSKWAKIVHKLRMWIIFANKQNIAIDIKKGEMAEHDVMFRQFEKTSFLGNFGHFSLVLHAKSKKFDISCA